MIAVALLIASRAADQNEQAPPGTGTGIGIILLSVLGIVLVLATVFFLMTRRSRASRGGVEPPPAEEGTRSAPPFEGVEKRS